MEKEEVSKASILGFSDGADLAVVFAADYPEKVDHLILNAVNTEFSAIYFPVRVIINLNYVFTKIFSSFSLRMKKRLLITQLMRKSIGVTPADLEGIQSKTLVIVGKQDIIKLSHSIYLVQKMPNASFVIVPKQGHSFACKDSKLFNQEILSFFTKQGNYFIDKHFRLLFVVVLVYRITSQKSVISTEKASLRQAFPEIKTSCLPFSSRIISTITVPSFFTCRPC